jgi:hypothetical protein
MSQMPQERGEVSSPDAFRKCMTESVVHGTWTYGGIRHQLDVDDSESAINWMYDGIR